ncbi:MAG: hypothetical protein J0H42_34325 [Rhizobiales bacterium]|nr:hypothetical protein [Hyphomicrobiales bacterium]
MVSLKFSMAKRARSSVPQFRIRVPAKVIDRLRGRHVLLNLSNRNDPPCIKVAKIADDVSFSLETTDRIIAEARSANALGHLKRLFELTEACTFRTKNWLR